MPSKKERKIHLVNITLERVICGAKQQGSHAQLVTSNGTEVTCGVCLRLMKAAGAIKISDPEYVSGHEP